MMLSFALQFFSFMRWHLVIVDLSSYAILKFLFSQFHCVWFHVEAFNPFGVVSDRMVIMDSIGLLYMQTSSLNSIFLCEFILFSNVYLHLLYKKKQCQSMCRFM